MDNIDKKDYIVNQLRRTFNKKYENYCITRIYHLLNRNDVQIITQQLFRRNDGKIALADLYFPQINLYIEIDEGQHKNQKDADEKRKEEICENRKVRDEKLKALGDVIYDELEEKRIDVTKSLDKINNKIDEIIKYINKKITDLGNKFIPWECCYKTPYDYIKHGIITCRDNVSLKTILEVTDLFNKGYKSVQRSYFKTKFPNEYIWCPKLKLEDSDFIGNRYSNEISSDGKYIYETKNNDDKFYTYERSDEEKRITFPQYLDETGLLRYKFKGIYKFNRELSYKLKIVVWEKVGDSVDLTQYFS